MLAQENFDDERKWILWNSALGVSVFVTIGRAEVTPMGIEAWLEDPYDMVGPFDFEILETSGEIPFAACVILSQERWQRDYRALRQESLKQQHQIAQETQEALFRFNQRKQRHIYENSDDTEEHLCRKLLLLPDEQNLKLSQIKSAYRKLVKRTHPDVGGDHAHFLRITEAYQFLLKLYAM